MNKEQIIDETYGNYISYIHDTVQGEHQIYGNWYGKKEFIDKCKTDDAFAKSWGLKIEDRELSLDEREMYWRNNMGMKDIQFMLYSLDGEEGLHKEYDKQNVPRRTITITYKNEKIEIYE